MNGYIVFSDLKGFSKLTEPELRLFFRNVLQDLSVELKPYLERATVWNTWGDAIVAVFDSGATAVDMLLTYRDFFKEYKYNKIGISSLSPRIAGHYGEFELFHDPLLGRKNVIGTHVNTTARIEPITRPGEIFVTKQFKDAIDQLAEKLGHISFGELGNIELAKNFGEREIFRLYKKDESPQIIDRVLKTDLSWALPEPPAMTEDEIATIDFYKKAPDVQRFLQNLNGENLENRSGFFILELADLCKSFGLYEKAIEYIQYAENHYLEINDIKVFPIRHQNKLIKLKANCLTRIGRFEEAADVVYGLWQMGLKDSDTLSMLAAQYKRRAIYGTDYKQEIVPEMVNVDLLNRAKDLYLEAFRLNIADYYPAINVAYLYKIIGGMEEGKGNKLASYIIQAWGSKQGEDWWIDTTLAEAELLQDDLEVAVRRMEEAISLHQPDAFQKKAVYEQVIIYSSFTGKTRALEPLFSKLQN